MTPIVLVDTLVDFIKPFVRDFVLQTNVEGAEHKAPEVMCGYLPEKVATAKQKKPDFPHVIVRYLNDDGSVATVHIIAGTYSEDPQHGWRDCMNIITRIKQALQKTPTIGAFRIQAEMKTELPEEQPFPEWIALLTLTVEIPQAQEEGVRLDGYDN